MGKYEITGTWKDDFKHDGMLYFAQRIEEMLDHSTTHIYKVPVLNTNLLVKEYLATVSLVEKDIVHKDHLKHIMEEFKDSFMKDVVIKEHLSEKRINDILNKINESSEYDQQQIMKYVLSCLSDYNNWAKEYLSQYVRVEKEKKKIEAGLRCYLPGLISAGYSKEYIYYYSKKFFSSSTISSLDDLDFFLSRFDFKDRTYQVQMVIDKNATKFEEILNKRLNTYFVDGKLTKHFQYDTKKYIVITSDIDALDERKAAELMWEKVSLFFRYYKFVGDKIDSILLNKCVVEDDTGKKTVIELNQNSFSFGYNIDDDVFFGEFSESLITTLLNYAHCSFDKIDKCVRLHNSAIESNELKNGFLNLWSIFEIICVTKNESKIVEIEDTVLPILGKDYISIILNDIRFSLRVCLSEEDYGEWMTKFEDEIEIISIAKLILLKENEEIRKDLYSKLKEYPLIRSRISQMSEQYNNKADMLKDVERFKKRLKWHLRRLYRTRNAIIHSGEEPANIKLLGEHLHSYVDELLYEIILRLTYNVRLNSIENVLVDIELAIHDIMGELNNKGEFSEENIKIIVPEF